MAILKKVKTIPELFKYITLDFGSKQTKPVLKYKIDNNYVDFSYKQLYDETENLALGMVSLGVKRFDKVSIIGENRPEWVFSDMAILGLGGIDVPLYPILTSESIEFILNNSDSVGIIVSTQFQLNKILKIRDKCRKLKFIIIMNDIETTDKDVYTFKQVQQKGKIYKNENPNLFAQSLSIANEDDLCTIIILRVPQANRKELC